MSEVGCADDPIGSMGDPLQRASEGARMGQDIHSQEKQAFRPKEYIWRWNVIAGLCLINGYRRGAELGVSTGRFSLYLCAHIPTLSMIAVDLWATQEPRPHVEGSETYTTFKHDESYERFKAISERAYPGRIDIFRMKTHEAAQHVPNGHLDFVFIDADHTYEGCLQDIDDWAPKVKRGGMICGHDINWPTVKQAVDARFNQYNVFHDHVWGTMA